MLTLFERSFWQKSVCLYDSWQSQKINDELTQRGEV